MIRSAAANPVQGASRASRQGQRAAKGREIVRRDFPDRDHPKLLEHVVDQPTNAAATAVRKSLAGGDDLLAQRYVSRICELTRSSRNVVARLPRSFAIVASKSAHHGNSGVGKYER